MLKDTGKAVSCIHVVLCLFYSCWICSVARLLRHKGRSGAVKGLSCRLEACELRQRLCEMKIINFFVLCAPKTKCYFLL
jgi:hypothetical protein